jgi:hypothetical protein
MSKSNRNHGSTSNGRNPFFLCQCMVERPCTYGLHEPYELRGSRTDLWGAGGETPPAYPVVMVVSVTERAGQDPVRCASGRRTKVNRS